MVFRRNRIQPAKTDQAFKYIVSACLAGIKCTYAGGDKLRPGIARLVSKGLALPICPEVAGGSTVPREQCEITGGNGEDVIKKKATVLTPSGKDVTARLISGAKKTLAIARRYGIKSAILKSNSPSCGRGKIYDGTFTGSLRRGDGVTAALLRSHRIRVYTEREKHG